MTIQKVNGLSTADKLSELKQRAEVAEEVIRGVFRTQIAESCPSIGLKVIDCKFEERNNKDCAECWIKFLTQQAKEKLRGEL